MGARIGLVNRRVTAGGEPVADLEVRHAELVGHRGRARDRAVAGRRAAADGARRGARRAAAPTCAAPRSCALKESDRIETTREALFACGAHVEATDDGWRIRGVPARIRGGTVQPHGDHRIAMLGGDRRALLGERRARASTPGAIDVSFPGFRDLARGGPARGAGVIVTIDGPAGAGKSTVAQALARRLGYRCSTPARCTAR